MKIKNDINYINTVMSSREAQFNVNAVEKLKHEVSGASLKYVAYIWDERSRNELNKEIQYLIYFTKNDKRMHYNKYNSAMLRDNRLFDLLSAAEDLIKTKKERTAIEKKQKEETLNNINVGDIFVSSCGYDQTNVEAYQVIEKKSNAIILSKVRLLQIGRNQSAEESMSCKVTPIKDAFINKDITIKKLIKPNGIKISTYEYAYKWDGLSTYYCSWYA